MNVVFDLTENIKYIKDDIKSVFIYYLNKKWVNAKYDLEKVDENYYRVKETNLHPITLALQMKIPKRLMVMVGDGSLMKFEVAAFVYNPEYIERHTVEVDDTNKFEEIHKKAIILLEEKLKTLLN